MEDLAFKVNFSTFSNNKNLWVLFWAISVLQTENASSIIFYFKHIIYQGHGFGTVPDTRHVPPTGTEENSGRHSTADKKGENWGSCGPTADQESAQDVVGLTGGCTLPEYCIYVYFWHFHFMIFMYQWQSGSHRLNFYE